MNVKIMNNDEFLTKLREVFPDIPKYVSKISIDIDYMSTERYPKITTEFYLEKGE